jgi:hypothetical protein
VGTYFWGALVLVLLAAQRHGRAYLWKVAGAVADEQTCLSAAAVADDDELLGVGGRLSDGRVARVGGAIGADGAVAVALAGRAGMATDGGDGRDGRLCALLAPQVVVVLRGSGGHHVSRAGVVVVKGSWSGTVRVSRETVHCTLWIRRAELESVWGASGRGLRDGHVDCWQYSVAYGNRATAAR